MKHISSDDMAARHALGDRHRAAQELVSLQDEVRGIRAAINILIGAEKERLTRIDELQKATRPTGLGGA